MESLWLLLVLVGAIGFVLGCLVGTRRPAAWGVWSLVLGICSVMLLTVMAPLAVWAGVRGIREGQKRGMATAGVVLGVIGCLELALVMVYAPGFVLLGLGAFWGCFAVAIGVTRLLSPARRGIAKVRHARREAAQSARPRPEYTDAQKAEFKRQWRTRKIMCGAVKVFLGLLAVVVMLSEFALEEVSRRLDFRLLDEYFLVVVGLILLLFFGLLVFMYIVGRCPGCKRNIIRGLRLPASCPHCGVELFSRAKEGETGVP